MDESNVYGNLAKQNSIRTPSGLKPTLFVRSSAKNISFRRLKSQRAPRREHKGADDRFQWVQGNRVVLWLIMIAVWAYVGFHVQSSWAHNDHRREEFVGYKSEIGSTKLHGDIENAVVPLGSNATTSSIEDHIPVDKAKGTDLKKFSFVSLAQEERRVPSDKNAPKKKRKTREHRSRRKATMREETFVEHNRADGTEGLALRRNTSHGLLVGPFGKTEDSILGWNADKRRGACDRKGDFARIVWSRSFVLIFHELSMTGAPLSMMELAMEILSCGGTVSAVVLIRKGGLMAALEKRGIKVLKDKAELSFKAAMKADLVIAGSAVCSSWIEQYLSRFSFGSNQILWWIMENRREYFDRAKHLLNHVKMLSFLSESQSKQWLSWCEEEQIHLNAKPMLVPLSVHDELAFIAGMPCSLNTPELSVDKMLEKRKLLRHAIRKEMGLDHNDVLIMSLSSINAGKGQRLLLEAALLVAKHKVSLEDFKHDVLLVEKSLPLVPPLVPSTNQRTMDSKLNSTILFQKVILRNENGNGDLKNNISNAASRKGSRKGSSLMDRLSRRKQLSDSTRQEVHQNLRGLLTEKERRKEQSFKVLIGSVGSKSNKAPYIKAILKFLSQHANLTKLVLWTPATTRVASLYAAADIYVINAQGIGETFGRVTVEAMAFGLPVLGTDAGGTKEIVKNNITGLLHPVGREGTRKLAENILYLLSNPSVREMMGESGRQLVQGKYLKNHTYQRFAAVLAKCMRTR